MRNGWWVMLAVGVALIAGCGDDDDSNPDVVDVPADEGSAEADVEPDGDVPTDVSEDVPADVPVDVPVDVPTDVPVDVPPDVPSPCVPNPCDEPPADNCASDGLTARQYAALGECVPEGAGYSCDYVPVETDCSATGGTCEDGACLYSLAAVRDAADGALSPPRRVTGLVVTYVKPAVAANNGFYAQEGPTGPGLFFWTDTVAATVVVGNTIEVTIDAVNTVHGLKEASLFTIDANDGVAGSVESLVQDLSAGGVVGEDTESELLRIRGAVITGGGGSAYTVSYGTTDSTTVYFRDFGTLVPMPCVGMRLDVQAPGGEYDAVVQVTPFRASDFSNLDDSLCPADDDSNWDFETWAAGDDPPEDFYKSHTTFFTVTEGATTVHGGLRSCNVTWSTLDNRDLGQTWYAPVAEGVGHTHHIWYWDTAAGGRFRPGYQLYDAARAAVGGASYSTIYTDDVNPSGWYEFTYTATPAAGSGAAFVRFFLRFYDVTAGWTGSAAVSIDDWAVTTPVTFSPSDGRLDAWTTTKPAAPIAYVDSVSSRMGIHAAISDAGILYLAMDEVTASWSDHLLFFWVGAPHATDTVAAPWSKAGTVAAPGAGGALFALAQEESSGYSEVLRWNGTAWVAVATGAATGFDGTTDGSGYVEATLNLVTALGLTRVRDIPGEFHAAVAPYGTGDGSALLHASQYPAPVTADANISTDETQRILRSALLVGNVM